MRRAGLAILFGFSIYLGCIATVTIAADFAPSITHWAILLLVAACHSIVGYLQLGEGIAMTGEANFPDLVRAAMSVAITLIAVLIGSVLAHAHPLQLRADTAELLLLLSVASAVLGLALAQHRAGPSTGSEVGGPLGHRPPRR